MAKTHKPAETEREWRALIASKDKTIIRSMKDWKAALADPRRNPLKGCDPKTVKLFTKSLKFKNGGLGHADYAGVDEQISYRQFTGLCGRFGLGMGLFQDYSGYECIKRADICTSNC